MSHPRSRLLASVVARVATRNAARSLLLIGAGTTTAVLLSGCAETAPVPVAVTPSIPDVLPGRPEAGPSPSIAVAGSIPSAQATAVLDALMLDLAKRLRPEASVGAVGVSRRPDGAPRVILDTAQAFESGTAQMRAETLQRLAECAAAVTPTAPYVIHAIGYGEPAKTPDGESLGERRATSVASYLRSRGVAGSRIRAEGRTSRGSEAGRRLELVFEPIVEGREVRAWMPPAVIAAP